MGLTWTWFQGRQKSIETSRVGESSWPWCDALKRHTTCHEGEMVFAGCPRIAARDPATAILNSKTLSTANLLVGEQSVSGPARRAGAFLCGYRRVLVLFFACQKTETVSNIVDTWCCSRIPSSHHPYIPLGRRPPLRRLLLHVSRICRFLFLSTSIIYLFVRSIQKLTNASS